MAKELKLGRVDDDGNLFVDQGAAGAMAGGGGAPMMMMGGGLGGIPWGTLRGGFDVVTGFINNDTAKRLQDDIRDRRDEVDKKRAELTVLVDAHGDPTIQALFRKQLEIERAEADAIDNQIELARLQANTSRNRAIGGGLDLAAQYLGGPQVGMAMGGGGGLGQPIAYVQQPGGGLLPVVAAGAAGYLLGRDVSDDRRSR
jgi:hypothetical protein